MSETVKPYGVLEIALPEGWRDQSIYTFVGPEQTVDDDLPTLANAQGVRPNVVITRSRSADVARYTSDQLAVSKRELPDFRLLEQRDLKLPLGPAIAVTFTLAVNGSTVQQQQVNVQRGEWVYTFTFSTLPILFEMNLPTFAAILESASIG
jgi:hypothetical protein